MDIGYIKLVVSHAAAVHGVRVQVEPIDLARIALKRLGLVGKGRERDRRPTLDELQALADYFTSNSRQIIPLGRIMRFAVATAMRQDEICHIRWEDIDAKARTVIVRDPSHRMSPAELLARDAQRRQTGLRVQSYIESERLTFAGDQHR
ncbi:tyrosine-type recombinase/integrase [Variovorax paradoxus]|uniref:tyrosine-type recombinase/integrase n=1 Tax=Variovorax paradoxus TaxID=34073 RepID=UPI0003FCE45A|nr:tyrosine-type recombinase/integrase [Variovorax paradoxus]